MFLRLSGEHIITEDELIGIFDLDNLSVSKISRDFLEAAQKKGELVTTGQDLPKAVTLCAGKSGGQTVFLTQVNASTLRKRSLVY